MPQKAKTGDYIIKKRRALEEKRDALRADVQERIVIGGIANWEVKTAKRIETNRAVTYFNKMKAEAEERLTERRKRLAAKLSKEQAQYEIEVENSFGNELFKTITRLSPAFVRASSKSLPLFSVTDNRSNALRSILNVSREILENSIHQRH